MTKIKKPRPIVLTIRLSTNEHRRFQILAEKLGLSLASLIRTVVLEKAL